MHAIDPRLTPELKRHIRRDRVWRASPFPVRQYRELVEHVARLAYLNARHLLFFRGQDKDYQSKAGGTTLYPAIYRGDNVPREEIRLNFRRLTRAERILTSRFTADRIQGHRDVRRKRYIQWSILQHYNVVPT